ncbi:hypothetical protein [Lumpfish ranavirus]|uniref:Uncharacterized protein n=1 Tax=Lumpfish ranavirus TaxID=2501771 RepID=A0A3Q9T8P4_9VIRU|nr:hypothetical protein [Lumpfish ranavirus]
MDTPCKLFCIELKEGYVPGTVSHNHIMPYFLAGSGWPVEITFHAATVALKTQKDFPPSIGIGIHNMTGAPVVETPHSGRTHFVFIFHSKSGRFSATYKCIPVPVVVRDYKTVASVSLTALSLKDIVGVKLFGTACDRSS